MTTPRHRYAIVIPTRNRQRFCVEAARSALAARREDVEIVIADASDDPRRLPALLRAAWIEGDVRLLPATGARLSKRENWERGLDAADAEWICVIGDDDALLPESYASFDALIAAAGEAECFAWETIDYRWPCFPGGRAGRMLLPLTSPAAGWVDARTVLNEHRHWRAEAALPAHPAHGPSIYHGLARRSLVDRIRARQGVYFQSFLVDRASAIVNLAAIERFVYLRAPLTLRGACGVSSEAALTASETALKRLDETIAETPELPPAFPELGVSRLSAPLIASGYVQLFERLGMSFMLTPQRLLESCLAELRELTEAEAFEREKALLMAFAEEYGLDAAAVAHAAFRPEAGGVGLVGGASALALDTVALGWRGVDDALAHLHGIRPNPSAALMTAIEGLARQSGGLAA